MPEIGFDYFRGDEAEQFSFFRIPRQLITAPQFKQISTDAKLLYGMLLDRMSLSARNGWYDQQGRVYIYYTVEEIREDMNCGNEKAIKLLSELDTKKGIGLIERVKQGQGKPTKIYVKRFTTGTVQPPRSQDIGKTDFQTSENPMSRNPEIGSPDIGKSEPNYNNINQTEISYTDPSIYPPTPRLDGWIERYEQRETVKEQIGYVGLRSKYPFDEVDSLVELLTDTLCSTARTLRIGKEELPAQVVKDRFRRLDQTHIEYVLDSLGKNTSEIRNIRAYLLTALYNAPVTISPYYSAAVRHDYG